ncbi:MAG: glycosyl hydrolase family 28-related protein [Firmicutes bacterium]|nr:glycosyl hydrolase family 28-related protein [Bacillota bacterium]
MNRLARWVLSIAAGALFAASAGAPVVSAHGVSPVVHNHLDRSRRGPFNELLFNNGTPYGAFEAPGTIPAADFNHGGSGVAYECNPNQGGNDQSYRPSSMVPISMEGNIQYITSVASTSGPFAGYVKNYVKYTFRVKRPGWYRLSYVVDSSSGGTLTTVVDGIQEGQSPAIPVSSTFHDVPVASDIYLTTGLHVVMTVFNNPDIRLSALIWSRTAVPPLSSPTLIGQHAPYVPTPFVAQAVVTAPLFGADPTGVRDSTAAIQKALSLVGAMGGGVVYVPPGIYRIGGHLIIPENTVLRGAWAPPGSGALAHETVFEVTSTGGDANGAPVISLSKPNAAVRDINVWYPKQNPTAPVAYPPAIGGPTYSPSVMNVTFYGAYIGIDLTGASESTIDNIYGTCLNTGVQLQGDEEYSYLIGVHLHNRYWESAPSSIITNVPNAQEFSSLNAYTSSHLNGVVLRRNDGLTVDDVSVTHANHGIILEQGQTTGFYGSMMDIHATVDPQGYNRAVGYVNTSGISKLQGHSYQFPPAFHPAGDQFMVVGPFVRGRNAQNASGVIQRALDQVAHRGGGVVYLPPGVYRIKSSLTVPPGVQLLGAYDAPHGAETKDTTVLWAFPGQNTPSPATAPALITMQAHSGVQGVTVWYPNQSATAVSAYPFTFRAAGPGTSLEYVDVVNGYNIVDLASVPANYFVVKGLVATALHDGIVVGGHTVGGWLQQVLIDFGSWFQSDHYNAPFLSGVPALESYTANHLRPFIFGDVKGVQGLALTVFNVKTAFTFQSSAPANHGPIDLWLYGPSSDTSTGPGYIVSAGHQLNLVGLQGGSTEPQTPSPPPYLETTATFHGTVNIFGTVNWATTTTPEQLGGTIHVYQPPAPMPTAHTTQVSFIVGSSSAGGIAQVLPGGTLVDSRYKIQTVDGRQAEVLTTNPYASSPPYSMLYFRVQRRTGFLVGAPSTLYLTVTYYDAPKGLSFTAEYNSSIVSTATVNGRYTPLPASEPPEVTTGSATWTTVTWALPSADFQESEKASWAAAYHETAGADFRIEALPGVAIAGVSVSWTPSQ